LEGWPVVEVTHIYPIFDPSQRLLLCQNEQSFGMLISFHHQVKQKIANPALSNNCIKPISKLISSVTRDENAPSIRKIKHISSQKYFYPVFT
jgi:hypothetical protein